MVILEIGSTTRGKISYFIGLERNTAVVSLLAKILPGPIRAEILAIAPMMPETASATRDDFRLNPSAPMPHRVVQI